jgi:ZIP family zinc transporter
MTIIFALATFVSTLCGGLFALRFKDRLHLILGFSAGAVVGVAFFDLIPEAISLGSGAFSISTILSITAVSFFGYMVLDRLSVFHRHSHEEDNHDHDHENVHRGRLGAGSLSVHSFLDGVAIGLAFQVSSAVGAVVAVAVLVHDFSDGVNTVNMILKNHGGAKTAYHWLLLDALAPVLGVFSTLFFTLPETSLGLVLAVFSGFFLYIGASDLLPESHHNHPTVWTTLVTLLGVTVLYIAIKLAGL